MNKITIAGRAEPDGLPPASIGINIQISFSDDAPPTLVAAIGRSVAEILTAWGRDDELRRIGEECEAIRARHQRQVDHAAETLLSRPAAPRESSRPKRSRRPKVEDVLEVLRSRRCGRCRKVYGDTNQKVYGDTNQVAACEECWPVRKLLGVEEPEP